MEFKAHCPIRAIGYFHWGMARSTVGCNKFASLSSVPSFSNPICIGKACHFRLVNKASYKLFRMVRRELSPQMRSRICELSTFGLSLNRILKLHPELNLSTIKLIIRREASRIDNASKSRSGRPRALTEEQRDYIYNIVNYTNPYIKMRELLCEVDDVIKKRLLRGLLREMGKKK